MTKLPAVVTCLRLPLELLNRLDGLGNLVGTCPWALKGVGKLLCPFVVLGTPEDLGLACLRLGASVRIATTFIVVLHRSIINFVNGISFVDVLGGINQVLKLLGDGVTGNGKFNQNSTLCPASNRTHRDVRCDL